ncbi:hypothetical protein H2198_008145 [Neophaeococcomyces mojaviensis]|uniref:Uncharacterized protein n=1 Tax=Neophaeococcomyces mojaviensis TaxID=3383035 RepID=A0ACC2ZY65_9EURO|nr:hypothetical protein H2198_008145 [Knufia sp. JES_112]
MASPPEVTSKNLSGKYVMNKSLSDDPDKLLALQGLSWLTRRAIGLATVVLTIKEYKDEAGAYHIDITSVASGLSTTQENRTLDWQERDHQDRIFGNCRGRSRFVTGTSTFQPVESYPPSDLDFLTGGHLKDEKTESKFLDNDSVQSYVKNQDSGYGWTAEQVWNFEEIKGKRYYIRRVVVKNGKGDKSEKVRLVYDYQGPVSDSKSEDDGLAYGDDE